MTSTWYNQNRGLQDMSAVAIETELTKVVMPKRGRPKKNNDNTSNKGENKVSEQNNTVAQATKKVQKTVFDLGTFANVLLVKEVTLPEKPKNVPDALALFGNDTERLLNIIYEGMTAEATDLAKSQMEGFKIIDEDGEPGEEYTGKFADETQGDKIRAGILAMAKMQGYNKDLPKEKKRELKEKAAEFIRSNPAMYQSL